MMTRAVSRASFNNGGTVVGLRRAWYFSAIGAQSFPYSACASWSVTAVPRMSQYPS
jgi:hypothetical protein